MEKQRRINDHSARLVVIIMARRAVSQFTPHTRREP